jgi:hypothetical protein
MKNGMSVRAKGLGGGRLRWLWLVACVSASCVATSASPAFGLAVPSGTPLAVDHAGGRIYWATPGPTATIVSARLDGTDVRALNTSAATVGNVRGLVLDRGAGRIYWDNATIDPAPAMISYANLDGSGGGEIAAAGAYGWQFGFTILDGTAYWVSNLGFGTHISVASLSGSGGGLLQMTPAPLDVNPGGGIAADPVGKRIYWSTNNETAIASANPDGSDTKVLPSPGARLDLPTLLQVDVVNRRVYFGTIEVGSDTTFAYANLDGTGGGNVMIPRAGRIGAFAIDPDTGRIYWPGSGGDLWSANLDGTDAKPVAPLDTTLHVPVIDDAPPASTPLTDASVLYHAVDKGVTLDCRLDGAAASACSGRSDYAHLAVGKHCFSVSERRNGLDGPAAQTCWTVTQLPLGCSASFHHGYFVTAGAATIARHTVIFHATTDGAAGRIALQTTSKSKILVTYQLDGHVLSSGPRAPLAYAQLDRTRSHTLTVTITSGGQRARIVRHFRYASFVAIACGERRVVGRIAPRTVRVAGAAVTVSAQVPKDIRGTTKLRFLVADRSHVLRSARFTFAGKVLDQHAFNAALTSQQLQANGSQTMTVALVPKRGRTMTVRIAFRTVST